ncbi:hypothetical protein O181_034852 [Austropuccinia psidii MF-1]|uniref:Uncharacterized protein n=1 Tax=Austropuccinia psidii MF-1 TaxID=1389203 RepID=A0A9Q3D7H3_9BASI|nr:hypothetical protein [Austropuccinia psidii MF-1]
MADLTNSPNLDDIPLDELRIPLPLHLNSSEIDLDDDAHDPTSHISSPITDDLPSTFHSSDLTSSPCPGLPITPFSNHNSNLQTAPVFSWKNSFNVPINHRYPLNLQTTLSSEICSMASISQFVPGSFHSPITFGFRRFPNLDSNPDQAPVLLQPSFHHHLPPSHVYSSQPTLPLQISKPQIHQIQLEPLPLSHNNWDVNVTHHSAPFSRLSNIENVPRKFSPMALKPTLNEEHEEMEPDPFSQLSVRTLALMEQPESEVTVYDCEYCEKTYQGKHARSIWRRHLSDKHKIPLATQPRRTRWDNDANRPKTEEERRERTLESKRRWARKNRAAKKAARDNQKSWSENKMAETHPEGCVQASQRSTPDRSRAPSPSLFPLSMRNNTVHPPEFSAPTDQTIENHSLQAPPSMTRGASAPQIFASYASMLPRTSFSSNPSTFNTSFAIPQCLPEWSFQLANSQSNNDCSIPNPTSMPSSYQSSIQFPNGGFQSHSLNINQDLGHSNNFQSPYPMAASEQKTEDHPQPHEPLKQVPFSGQYTNCHMGARFDLANGLVPSLELHQSDECNYEPDAKRPRVVQGGVLATFQNKMPDGYIQTENSNSINNFQEPSSFGGQLESSVSSHGTIPSATCPEEIAKSSSVYSPHQESGRQSRNFITEEGQSICSPTNERHDTEGNGSRPATAGTMPPSAREKPYEKMSFVERAATEPQISSRHGLQTPLREPGLNSSSRPHFGQSPLCRIGVDQARALDPIDLFDSPAATRSDSSMSALYHSHFGPTSASRRRSEPQHIQFANSSGNFNDWTTQALQTPSGFSRLGFGSGIMSSPANGGVFSSPYHAHLSRSLGLAPNSAGGTTDDCLGGLLGCGSSCDMIHHRT